VYRYLRGIFLDGISTRAQFAILVYCYRVKTIFHNLCTVLCWRLCGLTNSPIVKYPLNWGWCAWSAEGSLKQYGFRMANCFCCLSQNAMVCLAHCRQKLQQKSWKTARLFLQDRDQDQMFKTKTKTLIFVLEAPRDQDPGLEDYITALISLFYCISSSTAVW